MAHILIVEDEENIARMLDATLTLGGHTSQWCADGSQAVDAITQNEFGLILLDVMLPDIDGFTILQKVRERHTFPVIMLTAKTEYMDKINGLTLGADDYIAKPFNPLELIARVKAQLRRYHVWGAAKPQADEERLVNGSLVLDLAQKIAVVDGQEVKLTAKEYAILLLFMENPGRVFSAEQIYEHVWNEQADYAVENTVMVHIRHIREKIEDTPSTPKQLITIKGLGYKLKKRTD